MSMYEGTFIGVGYILSEEERYTLFQKLWDENNLKLYNELMDDYFFRVNYETWFFGRKAYDFNEHGEAKSIDTLVTLPLLQDDGTFGAEIGEVLTLLGVSFEEINTKWCSPNIYVVSWQDYA